MIATYRTAGTVTGALLLAALAVTPASAQTPTPTPTPSPVAPPSIAQVCAATGIAQVDDLLDGVARSQLVGELSPILTILVPSSDTPEVDASLQLADIRQRLNCAASTPTTTTPTPTPSVTTTPRTPAPATSRAPQPPTGFSQVTRVPVGSVETGSA